MAYMSQEKKKRLAPAIKNILDKYKLKGSLSVDHHMTLVLTIKSGVIDFIKNYNDLGEINKWKNEYWRPKEGYLSPNHHYLSDAFTGEALTCLEELKAAMMVGNHDNSDIMTDYFDVGWYISIQIGTYDKPYQVI